MKKADAIYAAKAPQTALCQLQNPHILSSDEVPSGVASSGLMFFFLYHMYTDVCIEMFLPIWVLYNHVYNRNIIKYV